MSSQPPKRTVKMENLPARDTDPDKKAVESKDGGLKSRKKGLSEASQADKSAVMVEDSPDLDERSVEDGGQKDLSKASKCSKFQTLVLGFGHKFFMSWVSMYIAPLMLPRDFLTNPIRRASWWAATQWSSSSSPSSSLGPAPLVLPCQSAFFS